jgi:hypothetical protein
MKKCRKTDMMRDGQKSSPFPLTLFPSLLAVSVWRGKGKQTAYAYGNVVTAMANGGAGVRVGALESQKQGIMVRFEEGERGCEIEKVKGKCHGRLAMI